MCRMLFWSVRAICLAIAALFGTLSLLSLAGAVLSFFMLRPLLLILFFFGFVIFGVIAVVALVIGLIL